MGYRGQKLDEENLKGNLAPFFTRLAYNVFQN
jgi:hypothetical protein